MAGLGLVGVGGLAGGQQTLQEILAARHAQQQAQAAAEQQALVNQREQQKIGQTDRRLNLDEEIARTPKPEAPARPIVMGRRLLDPSTGRVIAEMPPDPEKPQGPVTLGPGSLLVDPSTGRIIRQAPRAPVDRSNETLMPVIGDDGQPVLMPRSQAAGRRPASTREQGRPVTSGDAGQIAELQTSLDDVDVLEKQIGQTGAESKLGAMVPNFITEFTGFGEDAKQRQGTIDRVKQVIGKALEGGVLRKEDEYKYTKILPTIGDPPEVARTKIQGLRQALNLRLQREIEALEDANYDVTNFRRRGAGQPGRTGGAAAGGGGTVPMRAPDGRRLMVPADQVEALEAAGATRQ